MTIQTGGGGQVAVQGHTAEAMRWLLSEYLAMPGLSLTVPQMQRLLSLDQPACEALVALLFRTGCLMRRADNRCVRSQRMELTEWRRAVEAVLSGARTLEAAFGGLPEHRMPFSDSPLSAPPQEIDRILCPIDFSDDSRRALMHAIGIARQYRSSITAVHVMEQRAAAGGAQEDDLLDRLRDFVHGVDNGAVYVEAVVTRGSVASSILKHANAVAADLVVIGPGRWSDKESLPLASVTQAVMLSSRCPVLAIPRLSRSPSMVEGVAFARVLCAVDFSPASMQALWYAASLALQFNGCLRAFHVLDLASQVRGAGLLGFGDHTSWRDLEADALRRLRAAVPDDVRRVATVDEVVGIGSAPREILHAATEFNADLIVMGAQSRAGFDLLRFGSAAHAVVRDALCPVLLVRRSHLRSATSESERLRERVEKTATASASLRG